MPTIASFSIAIWNLSARSWAWHPAPNNRPISHDGARGLDFRVVLGPPCPPSAKRGDRHRQQADRDDRDPHLLEVFFDEWDVAEPVAGQRHHDHPADATGDVVEREA